MRENLDQYQNAESPAGEGIYIWCECGANIEQDFVRSCAWCSYEGCIMCLRYSEYGEYFCGDDCKEKWIKENG